MVPLLTVNALIFPEPEAANPILVKVLVQLYWVPVPLKVIWVLEAPLQIT